MFVRPDQIKTEVMSAISFLKYIYSVFGFECTFALSTRPKKALGTKETWDNAERQLEDALNESGTHWTLNPGDGAFYGPKIDIRLFDAMKRKHQCGTIQLDFNNPIRFNLQYRKEGVEEVADDGAEAEEKVPFAGAEEKNDKGEVIWREGKVKSGFERPVIIHRAILGSIERMSAILIEHFAGKWPLWLSPRQVMVVPVGDKFNDYAKWVARQLVIFGYYGDADTTGKTLNKKIREAQMAQWNYIAVVGDQEMTNFTVNLRERNVQAPLGAMTVAELMAKLHAESMPSSQPLNEFEAFQGQTPAALSAGAPLPSNSAGAPAKPGPDKRNSGDGAPAKPASQKSNPLEVFLEDHPYVSGFQPTAEDVVLFNQLRESGIPDTPNLRRWFHHVESFTHAARLRW